MRTPLASNLNSLFAVLALLASADPNLAREPSPSEEAGTAMLEDSSSALANEAWESFERKDYVASRAAIERCRSLYGAQAAEMQSKLTALPDKESAHQQWALNDVGTSIFLLGRVAEAEGNPEEAMAAYKDVVENYAYSQCWDTQGWFWQPAVAAKERIAFLTLEME
jgi:tetratricopeptide (TPR) repeat protein